MHSIDDTNLPKNEVEFSEFVNMAVHELKMPVTILKAYLQILVVKLQKNDTASLATTLEKMELQLDKLTHLIADLQDGANPNVEDIYCLKNNFDLTNCIVNYVEELKTTYPSYLIETDFDDQEFVVHADKDRIIQVVNNLVSNAVKYASEQKYLKLMIKRDGNRVMVSVIDRGPGIPEEKQQEIFEQFVRLQDEITRKQPGLGIGLFICNAILKKHNGDIGVRSKLGEGAEFWFGLPLV